MNIRGEGLKDWAQCVLWVFALKIALPIILAVAILIAVAFNAEAHVFCGPYHAGADVLAKKHGESVTAEFMTRGGTVILILANPDNESWTIIERLPDGRGCTLKQGNGFEGINPPKRGERT